MTLPSLYILGPIWRGAELGVAAMTRAVGRCFQRSRFLWCDLDRHGFERDWRHFFHVQNSLRDVAARETALPNGRGLVRVGRRIAYFVDDLSRPVLHVKRGNRHRSPLDRLRSLSAYPASDLHRVSVDP